MTPSVVAGGQARQGPHPSAGVVGFVSYRATQILRRRVAGDTRDLNIHSLVRVQGLDLNKLVKRDRLAAQERGTGQRQTINRKSVRHGGDCGRVGYRFAGRCLCEEATLDRYRGRADRDRSIEIARQG